MSKSLMPEYRQEKQKPRLEYAIEQIEKRGFSVHFRSETTIRFMYKGNEITHHAFTGWHSGKGITDGRGIHNLLRQLT